MRESVPFLSPLLPGQLFLLAARAVGLAEPALVMLLNSLLSKDKKPKVFAHYTPTEHDVFVCCFSKSGTNWAMQIATQTAFLGQAEFEHIHRLVAWPESKLPGIVALNDSRPKEDAPTGLRVIKTAFEADYVPYSTEAKYLCVLRDPKDVLVSSYYFVTGIFGLRSAISLSDWTERTLRPQAFMSGWPSHMHSYWTWRDRPNVLVLLFPDMKQDLPNAVDKVSELMGVSLSEAQRAEVIRKSGFAYMKSHESCFAPPRFPLLTGQERGQMLRSGTVGASREALSPEQCHQVDQVMLEELNKIGSDFPYAELFMDS